MSKPVDVVTIPGWIYPDESAKETLVSFMRRFQAAKRTAYQALRKSSKTSTGSFFQCPLVLVVRGGRKATIESRKEQVKMYVSDPETKIEKSEEKLERTKDKLHRQGILARLNKLRAELAYWKGILERGEVPPAVFGGRKNLLLLQEGKLSEEEWRELRSNAFYSVGQANQKFTYPWSRKATAGRSDM
ncbi:MAG: hypothetical protein ACPLPR_06950 [Bacillota bacterium]